MDENLWKISQILMWIVGIQTTVIIATLGTIYAALSKKSEKLDERLSGRIDKLDDKLCSRIEKLEEKVINIDKRFFAIETMLHMKDCCMLKDDRPNKKAE